MSSRLEIYFMTKMFQFSILQIKFLTLRYKGFEEQIIKTHDKLFLNCIGLYLFTLQSNEIRNCSLQV